MDTGNIADFSNTVQEKLRREMTRRTAIFCSTPEKTYPADGEYASAIVIYGQVFYRKIKGIKSYRNVRNKRLCHGHINALEEIFFLQNHFC